MKTRTAISGFVAALVVLSGGWFAGASAVNSGLINWLQFRSSDVPMCGVVKAGMTDSVNYTATEYAYNRSGSSCTSLRPRAAGYIRVHLYGYRNGVEIHHSYADNGSNTSSAYKSYQYPGVREGCFEAGASGREYDSDIGGLVDGGIYGSGQLCWIATRQAPEESSANPSEALPSEQFQIPTGVTADGRTFGSGADALHGGKQYDLVAVEGDSGIVGFADRKAADALLDQVPPSQTAELQRDLEAGNLKVDVYEQDGVTVVDTLTLAP